MCRPSVVRAAQVAASILPWVFSSPALAQERFGAVAGTWEACLQATQPLQKKVALAQEEAADTPASWLRYLKHRLAIELDRCAQISDAPLAAVIDLATRYEELELDERAIAVALRAIDRLGNVAELHLIAGRLLYRKGIMRAAVAHLEEVVAQRSTNPDANQLLGAYYYDRGDFKRALGFLRVAARERRDQFEPNAAAGDACLAVGDLACAGEYLGRASRLKPNDVLLAVKVGDLYRATGELGPAFEAYEQALKADPNRVDARLGLGRTAAEAGLPEVAQAWFVEAANRAPKNPTAAIEASRALRVVGRPDPSRLSPVLSEAGTVEVHVEYLLALLVSNKANEAQKHAEAMTSRFANDDRFVAVSGDVLLAKGSAREALDSYRRARQSRPDAESYLIREARALRQLGQTAEAAALLEPRLDKAGEELKAEFVSAMLDRVRDDAQKTDLPETRKLLAAAALVAPNDDGVRLSQAVLEATLGDEPKARAILETIPDSTARHAVEAWLAYSAKRFGDAARLASATYAATRDPQMLLLQGAALVEGGQSLEALPVLAATDRTSQTGLGLEWRAQALADAAHAALTSGRYQDAAALVLETPVEGVKADFSKWLIRVPLLARAAEGKIDTKEPAFKSLEEAVKDAKDPLTLDKILLALGDLAAGSPQTSLKRLRAVRGSATADQVADRARVELAGQLFSQGRGREARAEGTRVSSPDLLPPEARLNLAVVKHANDPRLLAEALVPFTDALLPAALLDLALVLEKLKQDGSAAIEPLTKLMTLSPPRPVRDRAEALLGLKKRLY